MQCMLLFSFWHFFFVERRRHCFSRAVVGALVPLGRRAATMTRRWESPDYYYF